MLRFENQRFLFHRVIQCIVHMLRIMVLFVYQTLLVFIDSVYHGIWDKYYGEPFCTDCQDFSAQLEVIVGDISTICAVTYDYSSWFGE